MGLRHAEAKDAVLDRFRRYLAAGKLLANGMSGKFERMQVGEGSLPARKRRTPIGAVGYLSLVRHVIWLFSFDRTYARSGEESRSRSASLSILPTVVRGNASDK